MSRLQLQNLMIRFLLIAIMIVLSFTTRAYTVSSLHAIYQNGQVFLTWKCPNKTNLKYNVYRSVSPISTTDDLAIATYIGDVRDSSSKNIRLSQLRKMDV